MDDIDGGWFFFFFLTKNKFEDRFVSWFTLDLPTKAQIHKLFTCLNLKLAIQFQIWDLASGLALA